MKIFLVGLPGSGKTTLGKELAKLLNLPFVDLDSEIEKSEGVTVQKIFVEKSESYFRQIESDKLKELCSSKTDFVMATGGGTPCFFNNIELMNDAGQTIFLNVPVSEIVSRLKNEKWEARPLLSGPIPLKDKIESLFTHRVSFYNQSKLIFTGNKISAEAIVSKIKD